MYVAKAMMTKTRPFPLHDFDHVVQYLRKRVTDQAVVSDTFPEVVFCCQRAPFSALARVAIYPCAIFAVITLKGNRG
jgi:hypothetical protein